MIKIGMMLGERYEMLEKIGTGGMSDVYKAKCHKLNRYVAVKVLKQEFSENSNFVSKFRVEAQAAASLMHPNIVNVYDVGEDNGIHYIVMELVEGITLKKYIEKKARLSVKEAVSIAIQACMGIEAAHNNHIIHLLYHSFSREVESSQFKKDVKNFVRLEPVLEYTKKHYNTPITLSEISQIACFQEEYFCHYFKKNMGVTYFQYLNEIRLSHIYRDLTSTDLPLKVLLEKHGFTNYKLFRKMFYEQFATTPGEYRKNAAVSD